MIIKKVLPTTFLASVMLSLLGCASGGVPPVNNALPANNTAESSRSSLALQDAIVGVWDLDNDPDKPVLSTGEPPPPTGFFPCYTFYADGTGTYWSGPQDEQFTYSIDEGAGEAHIEITWSRVMGSSGDTSVFYQPRKVTLDEGKSTLYIHEYWDLPDGSFTGWKHILTLFWKSDAL
ncbi:MAG: hypothetical protein FWD27_08880 [Coriobacteriia bacterium]|nr:hypothetical protein [Coriobacteriia bacterium]